MNFSIVLCLHTLLRCLRNSDVHTHAQNDQHTHAMSLMKKLHAGSTGLGPSLYAPIPQKFTKVLDNKREKLQARTDLSCVSWTCVTFDL